MHLFFLIYKALLSASSFVLSSGGVVIVAFSSAVLSMTFSRNFLLCLFWVGTEVLVVVAAVVLISVEVGCCEMVDAKNFLSPLLLCSVVVVLEAEK